MQLNLVLILALINLCGGLDCYECDLVENPRCLLDPVGLQKCSKTDLGCVTFFNPKSKYLPYRVGSKRCICQEEIDCLAKQGVTLVENKCVSAMLSWGQHENCITDGYLSDEDEFDVKVKMMLCLCKRDGCNSHKAWFKVVPMPGQPILHSRASVTSLNGIVATIVILKILQ